MQRSSLNFNLVLTITLLLIFSEVSFTNKVVVLNDSTWSEMMSGEWMVKFYAPWCPACRSAETPWRDLAKSWSDELGITVGDLDITISPGASGRFLITSLPTILHAKDGVLRQYKGARSVEKLVSFVQDKEWQDVEAVPWYKHPDTPHMACLGYAFRLSLYIRNLHDYITETHGYPVWASYVMFAVATILSAVVIGLIFVVILDKCCPAGHTGPPPPQLEADDLEDDTEDAPAPPSDEGSGDVRRRKPAVPQ